MSRFGKIGYTLIYNGFFLLIVPVLQTIAHNIDLQDILLGALAIAMLVAGILLIHKNRSLQPRGAKMGFVEPFVLGRDRLARGLIAGAMIWLNIYLVMLSTSYADSRVNPQAWNLFNMLALATLAFAWLLILTSPSDLPKPTNEEVSHQA